MKADEFLEKVRSLRVDSHNGWRAPHKPLLLLLALGRISSDAPQFVLYEEIEKPLKDLLKNFGPLGDRHRPDHPFGRLRSDGLWEIPNVDRIPVRSKGLIASELKRHHAKGGFPADLHDLLRSEPALVHLAAQTVLDLHFPRSMHEDILNAVGISSAVVAPHILPPARDPSFRRSVLRAYEHRCAFCGYSASMDSDLFGLEAAHIRWHSQDGPSEVRNGLALCSLHHKAFDRGALGLRPVEEGSFHIVVSESVHGSDPEQILSHHNKPVRKPRGSGKDPRMEHVAWHGKRVFRSPAID